MCVWDFYWVHTDYEVKTYPVSLHNCCLWMTSIGDSSGYPRVEALICKHPCTVNWAIELTPLTTNGTSALLDLPYNVMHTVSIVATNCNGSSSPAMVTIRIGVLQLNYLHICIVACLCLTFMPAFWKMGYLIVHAYKRFLARLSVTNLSSENNLPTFRLNTPVIIRA